MTLGDAHGAPDKVSGSLRAHRSTLVYSSPFQDSLQARSCVPSHNEHRQHELLQLTTPLQGSRPGYAKKEVLMF